MHKFLVDWIFFNVVIPIFDVGKFNDKSMRNSVLVDEKLAMAYYCSEVDLLTCCPSLELSAPPDDALMYGS